MPFLMHLGENLDQGRNSDRRHNKDADCGIDQIPGMVMNWRVFSQFVNTR
jgi:hypothetical protein